MVAAVVIEAAEAAVIPEEGLAGVAAVTLEVHLQADLAAADSVADLRAVLVADSAEGHQVVSGAVVSAEDHRVVSAVVDLVAVDLVGVDLAGDLRVVVVR